MTATRPLLLFFAVAYAYSWLVEACMIVWHLRIEFIILATLGPTLGALAARRLTHDQQAFRWNLSWARTGMAAALGAAAVIVSFVILPALAVADAGQLRWRSLASLAIYNYSTLLGGPLFEEPGWRGFALPRMEARFGPFPASLMLGMFWAVWHLPMFWYPGWNSSPIWLYCLLVIPLSIIMTATANLARFGVIAPILVHAVFNTHDRYIDGLLRDVNIGGTGMLPIVAQTLHRNISISFAGMVTIAGWIGAGVVLAATKGHLGYSHSGESHKIEGEQKFF